MLATGSHDRNIVMRPAGSGRLLVGGDEPTISSAGDSTLEIHTGTGQDLLLTDEAIVAVDASNTSSVLAASAGNDLRLTMRSDSRDDDREPHGDGVLQVLGVAAAVESVGETDLTVRSGGANSDVNVLPRGAGEVAIGGDSAAASGCGSRHRRRPTVAMATCA